MNIANLLISICAAALGIQLFYMLFFLLRIALRKEEKSYEDLPVSVIVCAQNEERKLIENLPLILEQNHPEFQVVVVNDHSWDDSLEILKAFKVKYPHLHLIHLEEDKHRMGGKKFALTLGIKGAKYENLVFIDADCKPCSDKWLSLMAGGFHDKKRMVLGLSFFTKKSGFLNKLIRFDALFIAMQYIGFARAGKPYMGVGRNLAYKKDLFFEQGGFKSHYHIQSGDDDLFVQAAGNKSNCVTVINPQAQTISEAKETFGKWFWQKKRHYTTAKLYKGGISFLLALFPVSYLLMWTSGILAGMLTPNLLLVTGLIVLRYVVLFIIFILTTKRIGQQDLIWLFPFWELLILVLQPVIYTSNLFNKPKTWG